MSGVARETELVSASVSGPVSASGPMEGTFAARAAKDARRDLLAAFAGFQAPVLARSLGQLATTFLPFLAIIAAMYALVIGGAASFSPWLCLPLAVPAAGLIVRVFIIQHDCGHGAFFRSRAANDWLGRLCSLITMTPYANWRRQHAQHHAMWNNLDRRDEGADIYSTCLTVREYQALSPRRRWLYRTLRHPLVAQLLLPPLVFIVLYRVPFDTPRAWRRERASVLLTNVSLVALFTGLVLLLGAGPVILVQLPTMALAAIIGVWIFSVQHRFEDVLWTRADEWNATNAAIYGSSHLKLPRLLQWFSGNIGFHHIHHLVPRVPNYRLEECHRAFAARAAKAGAGAGAGSVASGGVVSLRLRQALRAPAFSLWDEERGRMVRAADLAG